MAHLFSLAQLTVLSLAPPDIVATAARTGYHGCGMRLLPAAPGGVAYRLMDDPAKLRETLARMRDTGVVVSDLEIIRLADDFNVADYSAFFEVGQQLGASNILVAGDDRDEARLTANFATLCEAARPYGLTADIEFMPWTAVPNLRSAQRIVAAAAQENGGVLVDSLHFTRSDSGLDELEQLPRAALHYAQLCDAPALVPDTDAGLIHTARTARLLPGEGGIDLASIFARLPADLPISVEIPNEVRCAALGEEAWARAALEGAKALMARVTPARQIS
jgi:sugar phosphate isomerase/epimerase